MADYYPLLARALDALPDPSPDMRRTVYDRARAALIGQLRSIVPPLSEADIERERGALDAAIARLEVDHGGTPLPPLQEPLQEPAPSEPVLAPAPAPNLHAAASPDLPEPSAPVIPLAPRQRPPASRIDADATGAAAQPEDAVSGASGDALGRQRPRIDVVAPRRSNARLLRNVFVGTVLALVIGLIATAAYLLRDKPGDLQTAAGASQTTVTEGAETKYAERLGGEAPATERPSVAPSATPSSTLPPQADLAVAQRAVMIEENRDPTAPPGVTQGRVVWRLDSVNGERGQALDTAVHAAIDFPDSGLSLSLTLRRNLDATLPASHTIELAFTNTLPAGAARAVQDVGLIQAKDEENARGSPLSGLPVRVRENLFLIGLSSLRTDVDRNSNLLLQKNWFDLALKFSAGPRAVITFEKGSSGIQVMQNAFDQWRS